MSTTMSGGCHCGAIRYEISGEPLGTAHCFCTDCQKLTGTQMSTNMILHSAAFKLTEGKPTQYAVTGDSGKQVVRYFCSTCGTALWGAPEVMPDLLVVKIGSLDDSSGIDMGMSIYLDSAPKWAEIPNTPAKFPGMPPM